VLFKHRHIGPDLVEDQWVAFTLGKGAWDMAGDAVLHAAILAQGIGLQRLQDPE